MAAPFHIHASGDDYDVMLSHDGDHIVTKRDKRDLSHSWPVGAETGTWARMVARASAAKVHSEGRDGFFAETGCPYHPDAAEWEMWWEGYREAEADAAAGD